MKRNNLQAKKINLQQILVLSMLVADFKMLCKYWELKEIPLFLRDLT